MPKRSATVISEQSDKVPFALDGHVQSDLYTLFVNMQEMTYPKDKRQHLACPFWKFQPREYRHVRNSNCLFWGFRDIGELNEHIQRRHLKGKQSKSTDKGDHVPAMSSKQEAKWRQGNWKKAGSTASKWWKIAKAVTGYSMPEGERPDDFHFHFPGPDIFLIQRFESYRLTGSEDNSSQEDERPDTDITVFATDRRRTRHHRSSRHHHHHSSDSSNHTNWAATNTGYLGAEDEADDEPPLFPDPFSHRQEPSNYVIPRNTDSAYHSYEDPLGDSAGIFMNPQSFLPDGALSMDYTNTTGVLGGDFLGHGVADMGYNDEYPRDLADEDLGF